MPGSTPTVDTVMCRAPIPIPVGELRMVRTGSTAFQFIMGSPIPMNTMLVMPMGGSSRRISRTCAAISHVARLRENPMRPVAQNAHLSAQPACEEMHSVTRLPSGMATLSIASPSGEAKQELLGSVGRALSRRDLEARDHEVLGQHGSKGARQLGHCVEGGRRIRPQAPRDLPAAIRGLSVRDRELTKHALGLVRQHVEQVGLIGHGRSR